MPAEVGNACPQGGKRIRPGSHGGNFTSQPIQKVVKVLEAALRNRLAKLRNRLALKILLAADIDDVGKQQTRLSQLDIQAGE